MSRKVFNEDDRVLILLLIAGEPLRIAYCGLYTTVGKISNEDYITSCRVHTCSARRKNNRMHHVNMSKSYYDRVGDIKPVSSQTIIFDSTAGECENQMMTLCLKVVVLISD